MRKGDSQNRKKNNCTDIMRYKEKESIWNEVDVGGKRKYEETDWSDKDKAEQFNKI